MDLGSNISINLNHTTQMASPLLEFSDTMEKLGYKMDLLRKIFRIGTVKTSPGPGTGEAHLDLVKV